MKWNQALNLILSNITLNLDLDPRLRFKIVNDVPPFQCHRNNFNGIEGFKVQVGQGVNNFVEIPNFIQIVIRFTFCFIFYFYLN